MLEFGLAMVGAMIAWVIGAHAQVIGRSLGLMDYPDLDGGRKNHGAATPLVGGLALMLILFVSASVMLFSAVSAAEQQMLMWLILGVFGLWLIGALDDRFGVSAKIRLLFAAVLFLLALSKVPDFSISFLYFAHEERLRLLPGWIGICFTVCCFVGILNAVNMADGKNGMVIGQALIWAFLLFVRTPGLATPILAALIGGLAVLLYYNMQGRLFLGDSGSYAISAIFGLLAIYAWNLSFADMYALDVALIFALPVFDTLRLICLRLSRGQSPFTPGRNHLHHYLSDRWGWPRPLMWVLALVAIPNVGAIMFPGTSLYWLAVTFAGYLGLLWISCRQQSSQIE